MTEKLWRAVGALSDEVLAGSDEENVRRVFRARKKHLRAMFTTLAACLCICIIAGMCLLPVIMGGHYGATSPGHDDNAMSPGNDKNTAVLFSVGATVTADDARLTFCSFADGQAVFRLENTQDAATARAIMLCVTRDGEETVYTTRDGDFTVIVNGSAVSDGALPGARGTYEITVDLRGRQAENGTPTAIRIENFGRFALPGA